jgi:hypothetical protein
MRSRVTAGGVAYQEGLYRTNARTRLSAAMVGGNGPDLLVGRAATHPQAGRVQVPITSGVVSKDAVTFSGQSQFPLGGSIEVTFHGTVNGTSLSGTTDMTSRGLFGMVANSGPLTLAKQ